jgi:hypothetical protein
MERILLLVATVGLLTGPAFAGMYEMDAATAADMRLVGSSAGPDVATLSYVGYKPGSLADRVFGTDPLYGDTVEYAVGFAGELKDFSGDDSARIVIGLSSPGLTGLYDGFSLPISNDDNQNWRYQAYVTIGSTTYTSDWAQLTPDQTRTLVVDTGTDTDFSAVTGIGFEVEWKPSINGYSASDDFHTSVVPVPGAVLLGLIGLSAAGVRLRRFA